MIEKHREKPKEFIEVQNGDIVLGQDFGEELKRAASRARVESELGKSYPSIVEEVKREEPPHARKIKPKVAR